MAALPSPLPAPGSQPGPVLVTNRAELEAARARARETARALRIVRESEESTEEPHEETPSAQVVGWGTT